MTEETQNSNDDLNNSQEEVPSELSLLQDRATKLGIEFHHKNGIDKLKEKIEAVLNPKVDTSSLKKDNVIPQTNKIEIPKAKETKAETENRMRKTANKLIRIRVSCMNPNKKEHEGEIFTCGNSIVGTIKKYVPFNNEDGWHVPQIIYQMMEERQCQIFYTVKASNGQKVRKGKLIKEFAIEVLPPLTNIEIDELAKQQALGHNID